MDKDLTSFKLINNESVGYVTHLQYIYESSIQILHFNYKLLIFV